MRFARIKPWLPWLAVLGAAALFFLPGLLDGTTFYAFDILGDYWPWRGGGQVAPPGNSLLSDPIVGFYPPTFYLGHLHYQTALQQGGLAFWEPAILGGQPYQHYLSPIHYVLFSLLPLTVAHDVLLFCGLCLVGTFTFLYLRCVGVGGLAGIFGALAFMFNGYVMVWFEFEHILALSAGLAGALYFTERLLSNRSWTSALALALCLSAGIAIAHPQHSIYLAGFVACYFTYRAWSGRRGASMRPVLLLFAVALVTTAVLSLGFVMVSLDQILGSGRRSIPLSQLFRQTGSLPLSYLVTLVFPDFYGSPALGWANTPRPLPPQPYNNFSELCIYAGIPTLVVALMGLAQWRQRGLPRFFGVAAILCLLFAGGTVLYFPIAALVPGMSLSTPCRVLFLFGFSLSCLAALSLHRLLEEETPGARLAQLAAPIGMAALAIAVVVVLLVPAGPTWLWGQTMGEAAAQHPERMADHFALGGFAFARPLTLIALSVALAVGLVLARTRGWRMLSAGALATLLFVDLAGFAWKYNTRTSRTQAYPSTGAIRFLQSDATKFRVMTLDPFFLDNSLAPFGIEDAGGYGSFYPRTYGEYWFLSQGGRGEVPVEFSRWCRSRMVGSPLLDALNVKYVLTPKEAILPERHFRLVYRGEAQIYENLKVFPRAFLVRSALVLPDAASRLRKLQASSSADLASFVILEKDVQRPADPLPETASAVPAPIEITRYRPDELVLHIADPTGGFVVVSDNFHPNWRAWVDGQPAEILRANHIMRAVLVGPGTHTIEMRFTARVEIAGLLLSNLGWLGVLLVVGLGAVARRRACRAHHAVPKSIAGA